jgi:hypothetical protein
MSLRKTRSKFSSKKKQAGKVAMEKEVPNGDGEGK